MSLCICAKQTQEALSQNNAKTTRDSWEKRKKPKVQEGNAPIKILIKTSLFTQSSVTNGFLSLLGTVSFATQPESL